MSKASETKLIIIVVLTGIISLLLLRYTGTWLHYFISVLIILLCTLYYMASLIVENMKPTPSTISFVNKNIVITGGSSGIGLELARQIITKQCKQIILIARNEERLQEAVDEINQIKSKDQKITFLSLDLATNPEEVNKKVKSLLDEIKTIDILINCAGFSIPGEFQNLDVNTFSQMINVNYLGSVNITHAVVPYMLKQKSGQLVFLSSVGGQLGVYGFTAYSPSKYAIRGFAEVLYHELRPYGIGVSLVFPPDTETPGFENENKTKPKLTQVISEQSGLWKSEEVANIIQSGIENRKFLVGFGSDGYFMNALTGGTCPASTAFEFWLQTLLMPFIKIYFLFLQNYFTNLIDNECKTK